MGLPPGIPYVVTSLGGLIVPVGFLFVGKDVLERHGTRVPTWALVSACVAAMPALCTVRILWRDLQERREAAKLGARLMPRIQGYWPGNFDVLATSMREFANYCGDVIRKRELKADPGETNDMYIAWAHHIYTTEPEYIKEILATGFPNYPKGRAFQEKCATVLGTGVFNSDDEMWKFHRSITRPFFSRDRITHFELYEQHARATIRVMQARFAEGYAVDFQDVVAKFTLDAATEFLFGHCVHSLAAGLPYPHNAPPALHAQPEGTTYGDVFARGFAEAQVAIAKRVSMGSVWKLAEMTKDTTAEPMKIVNAYIEPILREAVKKREAEGPVNELKKDEVGDNETLLDYLLRQTSDQTIIRDEILSVMIAARDTTAHTLMAAVYGLATEPHVLTKLRAEIMQHVGPHRPPTYDDVRNMKYLRAVINETLRLFPPVPFDIRHSLRATTWKSLDPNDPRPLYIPANSDITYSVLFMHRRKDLWGPDAEDFDPDRFLDERLHKYLSPNPFIFLPFNAGPRICLGQQFAYNEISFMLVRLLQSFSAITLDEGAQPPDSRPPPEWKNRPGRVAHERFWPSSHITMFAKGGLWLKMTEATYAQTSAEDAAE